MSLQVSPPSHLPCFFPALEYLPAVKQETYCWCLPVVANQHRCPVLSVCRDLSSHDYHDMLYSLFSMAAARTVCGLYLTFFFLQRKLPILFFSFSILFSSFSIFYFFSRVFYCDSFLDEILRVNTWITSFDLVLKYIFSWDIFKVYIYYSIHTISSSDLHIWNHHHRLSTMLSDCQIQHFSTVHTHRREKSQDIVYVHADQP